MPATLPAVKTPPFVLCQLAHAALDHLAEALRNADLDLLDLCAERPPSVAHHDDAARDQVLDDTHHEQGIALASLGKDARQLGWKHVSGKAVAQVVGDCRLAQ
jgi:alpha-D-ribose 1-methylphosphonate 5-triphosphate diphosphatase PhnM